MAANNLKKCPFCDEDIKATALKCKHCLSLLFDEDLIKSTDPFIREHSQDQVKATIELKGECMVCGYELKPNANFCTNCGKGVK